ncbi:MAG: phosphate ABC transporter permease subunit PstC [Pirellulales bacterium]|nr:phosphate ABC transporter permease subunit PstC [Pirellulales bacterium]
MNAESSAAEVVGLRAVPWDGAGHGGVRRKVVEGLVQAGLFGCALLSIFTTVGIVLVLAVEAFEFFREVPLFDFLTGTEWAPKLAGKFGVLPLVSGTLMVTAGAAMVALPIGLLTAIYLSEYASSEVREVVKPVLEVLAGVPSVVFGYLAVVTVSPWIRTFFPSAGVFNVASASIVVGVMILPMIVSLSEDVLRSVPRSLREAAYALGATKFDVTVKVVVPAAISGIVASFLLALSRAIGETMAVALAAGNSPNMTLNPLEAAQTMTGYIVQVSQGDTPAGSLEYRTIFAVGLALFVSTMFINILAQWFVARVRMKYD